MDATDSTSPIPQGICRCGCGEHTKMYKETRHGYIAGTPRAWVKGHQNRARNRRGSPYSVDPITNCWNWAGVTDANGYGTLPRRDGNSRLAHIVMWEERHGAVPTGRELDHLCRKPACVNPDHLEAVDHRENVRRGATTILSYAQVEELRCSLEPTSDLASRFGISKVTAAKVRYGRGWDDVPVRVTRDAVATAARLRRDSAKLAQYRDLADAYASGLSYNQIAEREGISTATVYKAVRKVRHTIPVDSRAIGLVANDAGPQDTVA